ncbi:TRAP transporter small permease [Siminovitchia sp. FSL H7-0308]|uniref:TRAP-type C4-dicarboxylate transport system permease small subunit n=1 Tax=Siminovitchia thermophila TaxID=1245522 RepID=A0ABS2R252_9BACI|nr:TRAP transporter small permease [Siminovitchia thermophila]MBM7713722.1 TRAP-type C4-dicarboxylate transport system permease small subunit [Siminovitchia thermophila]ONK21826.1 TRAP transporter [Bacillus sp. VT-16-64]
MNTFAKKYITLSSYINKVFGYLLAFILATMTALIFWQVVARYVLGSSLSWSEELARFLMIFLVFIGAGLALRQGKLIAVEVILERLNDKVSSIIKMLVHLISSVFYGILIYFGFELAQAFGNQIAPGIKISMFYVYLSIPLGAILLLVNSIACVLEEFVGKE